MEPQDQKLKLVDDVQAAADVAGPVAAPAKYQVGEKVPIIVVAATPLGFKALINEIDDGIIYGNEVFEELRAGQKTHAYIKKIREDGKIDLIMQPLGSFGMDLVGEKIMKLLVDRGGFLPVNDKTEPEEIYDLFGVSKKKYKMALGGLYRKRLIVVADDGIRVVEKTASPDAKAPQGSKSAGSSSSQAFRSQDQSTKTPAAKSDRQPAVRATREAQPIFKPSRASKLFGTSGPSKK